MELIEESKRRFEKGFTPNASASFYFNDNYKTVFIRHVNLEKVSANQRRHCVYCNTHRNTVL